MAVGRGGGEAATAGGGGDGGDGGGGGEGGGDGGGGSRNRHSFTHHSFDATEDVIGKRTSDGVDDGLL